MSKQHRDQPFRSSAEKLAFRMRICEAQGWRCAYCGVRMRTQPLFDDAATVDEIVPLIAGGSRAWDNCVAACWLCNNGRGVMLASTYYGIVSKHGRVGAAALGRQWQRRQHIKHDESWERRIAAEQHAEIIGGAL